MKSEPGSAAGGRRDKGAPQLRSGRLQLNQLLEADAPGLFAYRSQPEVYRYQSWVPELEREALDFIHKIQATDFGAPGSWYQLALREPGSAELIGDVGLHFHETDASQVEIGFTIAPWKQGRGLAKHALELLLEYLFGALGKQRVTASVDPRNLASVAVLTHLGFAQESLIPKSYCMRGEWVDDAVYVLTGPKRPAQAQVGD